MTAPTDVAASGAPAQTADTVTAHTLLNCLIREVASPERQVTVADGHLLVRLARSGVLLRVPLRRVSLIGAHRFSGPVELHADAAWSPLGWHQLAVLVRDELTLRKGTDNEEFLDQVSASHGTVRATLEARGNRAVPPCEYLASEQSLVYGHRFHPTPKARDGDPRDWLAYGPETGSRFALRHLAVRADLVRAEGDDSAVDRLCPAAEPGFRVLPVHPWQFRMLRANAALRAALARGDVVDLGTGGPAVAPTSSVRTVYEPDTDVFLKFSLNVRITNCLRKNAVYELSGAVALNRIVRPVFAGLATRYAGCALLAEPGYRTLGLGGGRGDREVVEGFGVIVREGVRRHLLPAVTPLLAAAVADEYPTSPAHISHLLARADTDPLDWWDTYLGLLLPPVLAAYFEHGVVLEPHLQNVLIGVRGDGRPAQVLFRDLEGTKLLPDHHRKALAAMDEEVREPLTYSAERGWDRVVYCLLVNHVAELLGALADISPGLEPALWGLVRDHLGRFARTAGAPPRLRALLSGVPLPAKANLLLRWERKADRHATYVPLPSPLAADFPREAAP